MADALTFRVADVEGPLDLILTLIDKHKLDIYDIEITKLLEQYLAAISQMQEQMEVASEFLEMAARLVYIKSLSLLPRQEEQDALKAELTGQLLEYQVCKQMAQKLAERNHMGDLFIRQPVVLPIDPIYRRSHNAEELMAAYFAVAGKSARRMPPPKEAFAGIVTHRVVSVRSRIMVVLQRLYDQRHLDLEKVYEGAEDRSELVATFLAVLELVKDHRVKVSEGGELSLVQERELASELAYYSRFEEFGAQNQPDDAANDASKEPPQETDSDLDQAAQSSQA